nr:DUF362 domain-containing protein [Desulfobulbaceae bacterium]
MNSTIFTIRADKPHSVSLLLDSCNLVSAIGSATTVMLKPNLVEALQPPITTPVELVSEVVLYLRRIRPELEIIIAEGSGATEYETWHPFDLLGYSKMAEAFDVRLIDLNVEPQRKLKNEACRQWPIMYLPEVLFDVFLISIPVLKAHSLAGVTLTMKNMMGAAPPEHFQQGGHWKKAAFHENVQEAVFDLNRYRTPDFTILDASIGMQQAHLWGPTCNPPHNLLAASQDPVAIDAYGAKLLKRDWRQIGHIAMANRVLGNADSYQVKKVT